MVDSTVMSALSQQQLVAITAVDPANHLAVGLTRQRSTIQIDTRYLVGAIHVVPVIGEQWFVRRAGTTWALDRKLPFNTDTLANVIDNPTPGSVQVGSSGVGEGPLYLLGSVVNAMAPLVLESQPTSSRPDAAAAGAGAIIFDTTLGEPVFSTGTTWNPVGAGTTATVTWVIGEVPTGTKNGTNPTFIVGHNFRSTTTSVYRNGLREHLNIGYTEIAPNTLSFSSPPLVDDDLSVDYIVQ